MCYHLTHELYSEFMNVQNNYKSVVSERRFFTVKVHLHKIIGLFFFTIILFAMSSMPVYAATAQDYEKLGESFSPFLIIGIIVLVVWLFKRKK